MTDTREIKQFHVWSGLYLEATKFGVFVIRDGSPPLFIPKSLLEQLQDAVRHLGCVSGCRDPK